MEYWITAEPGYLRARLFGRETVEEMREFLRAVVAESEEHQRPAILIEVRLSRPIFHFAPPGFFEYFSAVAGNASCRIALLGENDELDLSHEYLALLARQQGLNVQSFRDEAAARNWLGNRRDRVERRDREDRRRRIEKRKLAGPRRLGARRFTPENPQSAS